KDRFLLDANGDGLRDILQIRPDDTVPSSNRLILWINTGRGFDAKPVNTPDLGSSVNFLESALQYPHLYNIRAYDYDGDGRKDLIMGHPDQALGRVLRSISRDTCTLIDDAFPRPAGPQRAYPLAIADVNGDGDGDLVRVHE